MSQTPKFDVVYLKEAISFLLSVPEKAQDKIAYNIEKCMYHADNELFKKLGDTEIWEFRTLYNGTCYRLFAFWDTEERALVIATHGIVKKTRKTPAKEMAKAEAIRNEYFKNKS